ncbi:hypothetical protein E1212_15410 [Jiangella ureilytica]|uniref:Uncharacterized protein n=1 Tax=Jiangella ureilytica TaxID=2530374 RepID=A0A4R4RNK4_9ACTN|nr:hypothetical protein [Jiangella ureilytica]TDC50282.1 hypothetical protein E1212_15410 [Jiangella ureilytica]
MSDPVAELNRLLYAATPTERRAILRAALPFLTRWMVESVDSCAEDHDADALQWPLTVATELLVPLGAAVHRVLAEPPPVPRQDRRAPTDPA